MIFAPEECVAWIRGFSWSLIQSIVLLQFEISNQEKQKDFTEQQ